MKERKPNRSENSVIKSIILILAAAANPFMGGYFISQEMSKVGRLAFITVGFFLLALAFGSEGIYDFLVVQPLQMQGQSIVATIVDVKWGGVKHQAPYITYEFKTKNGNLVRGSGIGAPPIPLDHKVEVIYLPDNPSQNLLKTDAERRIKARSFWKCMSFIFAVLAVLPFSIYYYNQRSAKKKRK